MRAACIVLLALACALILADAWSTRRALLSGRTEANRARRFLIRTLGINGGTFGVSALLCAVMVLGYFLSAPSPSMIVAYGSVVGIYAMLTRRQVWR